MSSARATCFTVSWSSPVRHSFVLTTAALAVAATSTQTLAQNTLAQRIAKAPDGVVRVQFTGRPLVCGDGRDMIGYRNALFAESFQSIGHWNSPTCVPGPVRVALMVADGRVTMLKTSVGNTWPRISERVTDLGTVSSGEAATYFFGLVPQLERNAHRHDSHDPSSRGARR